MVGCVPSLRQLLNSAYARVGIKLWPAAWLAVKYGF